MAKGKRTHHFVQRYDPYGSRQRRETQFHSLKFGSQGRNPFHHHTDLHYRIGRERPTMEHSGDHAETNRGKHHEAHLIPGIDGHRIWGFPNSIITKIRYADVLSLSSAAGARAINVYAANGIFDPDITGIGHQPMYRDQYAGLYDQYVVIGSKITVQYAPSSITVPMLCGIAGDDDSSISATVDTLMEQNNSVSLLANCAGSKTYFLEQTFEPLAQFGVDAKDDGASATAVGSNPSELWCYGVWVATADPGAAATVCQIKVEIEYTVKFTELQTPTQN